MAQAEVRSDRAPTMASLYADKPGDYFANARRDMAELLATGRDASVLELGCGSGATGRAVLEAGKAGRYVGLELNAEAAARAAEILSEVVVGDVEQMDLERFRDGFDALLISEVLEHLTDPWRTLAALVGCLKPGGVVMASSPNIAHWRVVGELLAGRFAYRESGVMDRTHLRWFTPESYRALFESAGVKVEQLRPLRRPGWKAQMFNRVTGGRFEHLFYSQMMLIGRRA